MIDLDTHPDWQSLLAHIIAHPDEDLARLVGADWLEEHESQDVRCRVCLDRPGRDHQPYPGGWDECGACEGSGYVSNGLALRAEFIRLQVEIASVFPPPDRESQSAKGHRHDLVDREQVLLTFDNELLRFGGAVITDRPCLIDAAPLVRAGNAALLYQRGFVSEARCPMGWWLAPEHGPRIARANPIRKVIVTDRRPLPVGNHYQWMYRDGSLTASAVRGFTTEELFDRLDDLERDMGSAAIDVVAFDRLAGGERLGNWGRTYPTEKDALDDLSQALIAWARATK